MEDKMAQQNIYDDEIFFEGYKKIRDNKINANNLFEMVKQQCLFGTLLSIKVPGRRFLFPESWRKGVNLQN
jgi:hypothetical protein